MTTRALPWSRLRPMGSRTGVPRPARRPPKRGNPDRSDATKRKDPDRPLTPQDVEVNTWIMGTFLASIITVSLAMLFWSGHICFWIIALAIAGYLPTPVTDPLLERRDVFSCVIFGIYALAYLVVCSFICWWVALSAFAITALAAVLLLRLKRKWGFHLPPRPEMTFRHPPERIGTPLYFSVVMLAFAALGAHYVHPGVLLAMVLISPFPAAAAVWNWAWGVSIDQDGLLVHRLTGDRFYLWSDIGRPWFSTTNWYLYDKQEKYICSVPAHEAASGLLYEKMDEMLRSRIHSSGS